MAEKVEQEIESKGPLFIALRNVMNPDDCAYLLGGRDFSRVVIHYSATLLRRVSSPDKPLVLVTCKPEFIANSVIMEITEPGNEAATPQTQAGELLRKTEQS
jgi:hypothetical protein